MPQLSWYFERNDLRLYSQEVQDIVAEAAAVRATFPQRRRNGGTSSRCYSRKGTCFAPGTVRDRYRRGRSLKIHTVFLITSRTTFCLAYGLLLCLLRERCRTSVSGAFTASHYVPTSNQRLCIRKPHDGCRVLIHSGMPSYLR